MTKIVITVDSDDIKALAVLRGLPNAQEALLRVISAGNDAITALPKSVVVSESVPIDEQLERFIERRSLDSEARQLAVMLRDTRAAVKELAEIVHALVKLRDP